MSAYIYVGNGSFISGAELYHYGIKGMKWGKRKAVDTASLGGQRRPAQAQANDRNSPEARAARAAKVKKAAKIGAAVVGTALAAYGTYKLAKYVQGKRSNAAMKKAEEYLDNNFFHKVGVSKFADGTQRMDFATRSGTEFRFHGSRNAVGKDVGAMNAKAMSKARQIYSDNTNTRLDRGLAKVVGAGDAVGNTAKRAANKAADSARRAGGKVKDAATKAKNSVLDVVNPIYEYTPTGSTTKTREYFPGVKYTETITNLQRQRKKRS